MEALRKDGDCLHYRDGRKRLHRRTTFFFFGVLLTVQLMPVLYIEVKLSLVITEE